MGKGNVAKSAQKRERNAAKAGNEANQHSILKTKDQAMTIKCKVCMTAFMGNSGLTTLQQHQANKHEKSTFADCFPEQAALVK